MPQARKTAGKGVKLTVETCVRAREAILVAIIAVDIEFADTVHTLQLLEAVERDLASTRDKLEQLGAFFLIEGADCTPEPLDLRRGGRVVVIIGIILPLIDVDLRKTRDQKFQLLFVEDGDQVWRNDLVEAGQEIVDLLLDRLDESVLDNALDIVLLVLLGDGDVAAVLDQVDDLLLAKVVSFDGEGLSNNIRDIILQHPEQRLVVVQIQRFHILDRDSPAEDLLVNSAREMTVQNASLVESLGDDPPNESEEQKMLRVNATEAVRVECGPIRSNGGE
jgi:hypothetical protein